MNSTKVSLIPVILLFLPHTLQAWNETSARCEVCFTNSTVINDNSEFDVFLSIPGLWSSSGVNEFFVSMDITHDNIGDLRLNIRQDSSSNVLLWRYRCDNSENLNVVFVDSAGSTVSSQGQCNPENGTEAVFARGDSRLSSQDIGETPAGNYRIRIRDDENGGQTGIINSVCIGYFDEQGCLLVTSPTSFPTNEPSLNPSFWPTMIPSESPITPTTMSPSEQPSDQPSQSPSTFTQSPSLYPSVIPTVHPTLDPSVNPTENPSKNPTVMMSDRPTISPSHHPSDSTIEPSVMPTDHPMKQPTKNPTNSPLTSPTQSPSQNPLSSGIDQYGLPDWYGYYESPQCQSGELDYFGTEYTDTFQFGENQDTICDNCRMIFTVEIRSEGYPITRDHDIGVRVWRALNEDDYATQVIQPSYECTQRLTYSNNNGFEYKYYFLDDPRYNVECIETDNLKCPSNDTSAAESANGQWQMAYSSDFRSSEMSSDNDDDNSNAGLQSLLFSDVFYGSQYQAYLEFDPNQESDDNLENPPSITFRFCLAVIDVSDPREDLDICDDLNSDDDNKSGDSALGSQASLWIIIGGSLLGALVMVLVAYLYYRQIQARKQQLAPSVAQLEDSNDDAKSTVAMSKMNNDNKKHESSGFNLSNLGWTSQAAAPAAAAWDGTHYSMTSVDRLGGAGTSEGQIEGMAEE